VAGPPVEISLWRANVHDLVAECAEQWGLRLGEPYVPGVVEAHLETVRWLLEDA
jgi:hypothetical protein